MTCHNGGTLLAPAAPNVMAEIAKVSHPLPAGNNFHDAAETAVLNNNRHATCVDCHSAHGSNQVSRLRRLRRFVLRNRHLTGISASDGATVLLPALNQYENCLRCHGTSVGKQRLMIYGYAPARLVSAPDPPERHSGVQRHCNLEPSRHPRSPEPAAAAQFAHQYAESEWHGRRG